MMKNPFLISEILNSIRITLSLAKAKAGIFRLGPPQAKLWQVGR